jgi:hypothetical protein
MNQNQTNNPGADSARAGAFPAFVPFVGSSQ